MAKKPIVAVMPTGHLFAELFPSRVLEPLGAIAEIRLNPSAERLDGAGLREFLNGATGCITSWGSPAIMAPLVSDLPDLKFVGHAAGTLRGLTEPAVIESGVTVCHSARIIAIGVGEMALCLSLVLLRNICAHDRAFRNKGREVAASGHYFGSQEHQYTEGLFDQKVGLVGFGFTGREFATRLRSFTSEVVAYDPFIDQAIGEAYGVRMTSLDEVLASKVVSLHAASIPESYHIINARSLALIPDGSILVNTARGTLVDEVALAAELSTGRIKAAIDVYDPEPPSVDSPLRNLDNLVMTPHISGPSRDRRWSMAQAMVDDFRRFLSGAPLEHQLDVKRWSTMG